MFIEKEKLFMGGGGGHVICIRLCYNDVTGPRSMNATVRERERGGEMISLFFKYVGGLRSAREEQHSRAPIPYRSSATLPAGSRAVGTALKALTSSPRFHLLFLPPLFSLFPVCC